MNIIIFMCVIIHNYIKEWIYLYIDDLGNYDNHSTTSVKTKKDTELTHLLLLKNSIYSKEFRQFISQIIPDAGELSDRIDCSVNAYANSCHLLCHDDVIGLIYIYIYILIHIYIYSICIYILLFIWCGWNSYNIH